MNELVLISAGRHGRLADVLTFALQGLSYETVRLEDDPLPLLQGKRLLFALSVGRFGLDDALCGLVAQLRASPDLLRGSCGSLLIDGEGELYTKQMAHMVALATNGAGCCFPGKPLVEGTGSLHNLDVQSKRMHLPNSEVYRQNARALVQRLLEFVPPKTEHPQVLILHASSRRTSNTLALGERVADLLRPACDITEISLQNGEIHDCRGCSYPVCSHFAELDSCFYGGSIVDDVYPALRRCNALLLLCPNYNDSVSANIMACINRLTSLTVFGGLEDKYLFSIIVSGYSGSDLVAQQVLGALCLNKSLILPPGFCLMQTANDPGSAVRSPGIDRRIADFSRNILEAICTKPTAPF